MSFQEVRIISKRVDDFERIQGVKESREMLEKLGFKDSSDSPQNRRIKMLRNFSSL